MSPAHWPMSDSSVLARHLGRAPHQRDDVIDLANGSEDLGSFNYLRGTRDRATMLEFRKKDGIVLALGYGWLERAEFNPSDGITLHFSGRKIRIQGRNLNAEVRPTVRLFEGITRHRIVWLREAKSAELLVAQQDACVIDLIEW
jgi:hypothetical protein